VIADVVKFDWLRELFDSVSKGADAFDGDVDLVFTRQCERVWRDDAGAGEQETAVGKGVVTEEVLDQCRWIAFQFG
jgi:hypothetical protein